MVERVVDERQCDRISECHIHEPLASCMGEHAGGDVHADDVKTMRPEWLSRPAGSHADLQDCAVGRELLIERFCDEP